MLTAIIMDPQHYSIFFALLIFIGGWMYLLYLKGAKGIELKNPIQRHKEKLLDPERWSTGHTRKDYLITDPYQVSVSKRVCGFLIDLMVILIVRYIALNFFDLKIPWWVLMLYWLLRDSIAGRSLGKLIFGTRVEGEEIGKTAKFTARITRNILIALPFINILMWLTEFLTLAKDPAGQRIGDQMADTHVHDLHPGLGRKRFTGLALLLSVGTLLVSGPLYYEYYERYRTARKQQIQEQEQKTSSPPQGMPAGTMPGLQQDPVTASLIESINAAQLLIQQEQYDQALSTALPALKTLNDEGVADPEIQLNIHVQLFQIYNGLAARHMLTDEMALRIFYHLEAIIRAFESVDDPSAAQGKSQFITTAGDIAPVLLQTIDSGNPLVLEGADGMQIALPDDGVAAEKKIAMMQALLARLDTAVPRPSAPSPSRIIPPDRSESTSPGPLDVPPPDKAKQQLKIMDRFIDTGEGERSP